MAVMISYDKYGTSLARWSGSEEQLLKIAQKEKDKPQCAKIKIGTRQIYP